MKNLKYRLLPLKMGGIYTFRTSRATSSDLPPVSNPPPIEFLPKRKTRKKLYIALAAVLVVVVVVAALSIPQSGAVIPLEVNYEVGEKMIYDNKITGTFRSDNATFSVTSNATIIDAKETIEVVDFDGEYYTLNHTTTMTLTATQKPISLSYLEKMNKTGYSTYFFNFGSQQLTTNTNGSAITYLTELLSKEEVRVGDSLRIPFPITNVSLGTEVTGDLTMTFKGFEDLTVPAGTYKVFRVDLTSSNLNMHSVSSGSNATFVSSSSMEIGIDLDSQIYVEYGTLRQIKSIISMTLTYKATFMNLTLSYAMDMSGEMTLVEHIKP